MERQQFLKSLNNLLQPSLFNDFCPNGLQVEGCKEVKKVATAVSADLATIEKAVNEGVDTLVVHHGLFWNKDPYPVVGVLKKRLKLLLDHQINLMAYHLPLDAHVEVGNNWCAARDLGLRSLDVFREFGVIGECAPQSFDGLKQSLESYYGQKAVVSAGGNAEINRVALISGGAYRELRSAAEVGADAFITGNFDEPAWSLAKEYGIHFFSMGHTATEKVGPKALCIWIKENLQKEVFFIDSENKF
jgi:dinuclear metal center YbgI/SA1388 family protein